MESEHYGKRRENEGIQLAYDDTAPEVVPRPSSHLLSPWDGGPQQGDYYAAPKPVESHANSQRYSSQYPANYYSPAEKRGNTIENDDTRSPEQRRLCGFKRRTAIILLIVIIVVIIIAVVLAGVLSTQLKSDHKSSSPSTATSAPSSGPITSPLPVQSGSGIAAIAKDAQGQTWGYYQDQDNNIIEAPIQNGKWQIPNGNAVQQDIVTTTAQQGSLLAALAWSWLGADYRLVFFLDNDSRLTVTNRTLSGDWSTPVTILTQGQVLPGTMALDAFMLPGFDDNDSGNALRVYYGSPFTGIREVGWGTGNVFNDQYWDGIPSSRTPFLPNSDSHSGVAVTQFNKRLNMYLKNNVTGFMNQWSYGYSDNDAYFWTIVAKSSSDNPPITAESDITSCTDSSGLDWIFYQTTGGKLVKVNSDTTSFSDYITLDQSAAYRSKLRALCRDITSSDKSSGAVVYYQTKSDSAELSYLEVGQNGQVTDSGIVQI